MATDPRPMKLWYDFSVGSPGLVTRGLAVKHVKPGIKKILTPEDNEVKLIRPDICAILYSLPWVHAMLSHHNLVCQETWAFLYPFLEWRH